MNELELVVYEDLPNYKIVISKAVDPTKTQTLARQFEARIRAHIKAIAKKVLEALDEIQRLAKLEFDAGTLLAELKNLTAYIDPLTAQVLAQLIIDAYRRGASRSHIDLRTIKAIDGKDEIPDSMADVDKVEKLKKFTLEFVHGLQVQMINQMRNAIMRAILDRTSISELKNEIKKIANKTMTTATSHARTQIVQAYNIAKELRYTQAGVKFHTWQSSRSRTQPGRKDVRTCDVCDAMHGRVAPIGSPFAYYKGKPIINPPAHYYCRCTTRPVPVEIVEAKLRELRLRKPVPLQIKK